MEFTLPEGSSKGHEQLDLFQAVGFSLSVEEAKVLVTRCGIAYPELPMVAVGSLLVSGVVRNSEITEEIILLSRVTSFQEPGWESGMNGVGRGKRLVKWAKNWSSVPLGKPSSKDLDGMFPMRFSLPGQWVQSAGPLSLMSCCMPRQCSISSAKGDSPPLV
jgi:hypothetical protein